MNACCELPLEWYSPLDSRTTEIARYSAHILERMMEFSRIVTLSDAQGGDNPEWWRENREGCEAIPGVAPLPVYHIGNNPAHLPIYEKSLCEPGLVVLHDLSLVDLARHISRDRGEPDWWKRQMVRQYGESVSGLVHRSENSAGDHAELISTYPLFLPFVENAMGVVVHSDYARNVVVERLPAGSSVVQLNLPAHQSATVPARKYDLRPLQLVFCGHLGPNRRLVEFFEAWGTLPDPSAFRLQLYGNILNQVELMKFAEREGVSEYVEVKGFVSDDELEAALHSAHFALNLRWPTMGEASASQLRYWSAGLPSLVTDVGWYSELPDNTVCKISPASEVADIAALMQDALIHPEEYQSVGQRGWEHLGRRHGPQDYARQMADFARGLLERRLVYRSVDMDMVGKVAEMCEDGTDIGLFSSAIEAAIEMTDTKNNQNGDKGL